MLDSLSTALKTQKEDTAKVNTLLGIVREFINTNPKPDSAMYFGKVALALATKLNYQMGIAYSHLLTGSTQWHSGNYEDALKNVYTSLSIYDKIILTDKTVDKSKILKQRAFAYTVIGSIDFHKGNYMEALKTDSIVLQLRKEIGDKDGIAGAYNNIGLVFRLQGNYAAALKIYSAALSINQGTGNKLYEANIIGNIGATYSDMGNYAEAIKNYFASLKIKEEIGNKNGIATAYENIGNIYNKQSNHPEALKYYFNSLKILKEIEDNAGIAEVYNNIGTVYQDQDNYSEALKYHFSSLKIKQELGIKAGIVASYANLGNIYYRQSNFPEALKNHFASLKIAEEIGDKDGISISCNTIGNVYIKQKKYSEAHQYLNKGLSLAKEIGSMEHIRDNYLGLATLDSAQGNFKNSLGHYKLYFAFRDSLKNNEITQKITQQRMQYDFDKKEAVAKTEQESKDVIVQQQIQKQKIIRNSFIAGSILLLLLIIVLINRNKLKRIVEMEKMRSRLSRDLHDDIGSTLSSINILSRTAQTNLKEKQDNKTKASLEKINERSQRLLDNMSDIIWNINPGNDTIEEVMSRMREYATTILEAKNIDYTFNFPNEKMDCKLSMEVKNNMYLIFKEAVNNLSKYSGSTLANLSLTFDERNIHLKIEDNGIGFNEDEIKHRGGLSNMQHRAEEIKGVIKINSVIDKGTVIELTIPRYC